MTKFFRFSCVVLMLVTVGAALAMGQVTTGTISGTVKNASEAVLPGSTVTVKSLDTGVERTVLTDDAGLYRITNLALGTYEITASLDGRSRGSAGIISDTTTTARQIQFGLRLVF